MIRRSLRLFGPLALLAGLTVAGALPASADTGPAAPGRIAAARVAATPTQVAVSWRPVPGVHHYNVSVFDGTTDRVNVVYPGAASLTVPAADPCARYRVTIGSRDAAGAGATSGPVWVNPLAPGAVTGLSLTRSADLSTVTANWTAPAWAGYGTFGGYKVQLVRLSDSAVIGTRTSADTVETYTGLDPARMYVVKVTAINGYGSCADARMLVGSNLPYSPPDLTAVRAPSVPAQVDLSWRAPAWTGDSPVAYYLLGYGPGTIKTWVRVDGTSTTVSVDPTRSWSFSVQAVNGSGKSQASAVVKLASAQAEGSARLAAGITIEQTALGGTVTVRLTGSVGSVADYPQLVVRIRPTLDNGGFSDVQYAQNGAQVITFNQVPVGVYTVQVSGVGPTGEAEWGRQVTNVGAVGALQPAEWAVVTGHATIGTASIDIPSAGENRVMSTRVRTSSNMVLTTTATLRSGAGYGVWSRASYATGGKVSGYSFQYDPGYAAVDHNFGPAYLLRLWSAGNECSTPLKRVKMPTALAVQAPHKMVVVVDGDSLYASLDNVVVFNVPSLAAAMAASPCKWATPNGTGIGFRTWGTGTSNLFEGTTLN